MDDRELERLLLRYRPLDRLVREPPTWPWALAAAALLALTIGLHAFARTDPQPLDSRTNARIDQLTQEFAGTGPALATATWLARHEAFPPRSPEDEAFGRAPGDAR